MAEQVVVTMSIDDWNLLRETLEMDAVSSSFDKDLRDDIQAALDRLEWNTIDENDSPIVNTLTELSNVIDEIEDAIGGEDE